MLDNEFYFNPKFTDIKPKEVLQFVGGRLGRGSFIFLINYKAENLELTSGLSTHTIAFSLPLKYINSPDFDPGAVSSIGSPIVYSSSNTAVATIIDNKIHIVGKGTSNITASAVGNGSYPAATNVQQLIVQCSCVQ